MSDPVGILIVDDSPDHADMVVEFIRLTDSWCDARVDTAHSFEHALRAFHDARYDVAFFDYWLGARNGLSLLREIRGRGVDTPVVVLTSRGAEEVAVEAMKAGAADYLSKSQLSVEAIARTIRHALAIGVEERSRRQAQAAVRSSEERLRALVENSFDALLLLDATGRIIYLTQSSQRHLGWPHDEMLERSIFDFVHPADTEIVRRRLDDALGRPGEPVTGEVRFRHADGSWRHVEGVAVNRLDEPAVAAIILNLRDMTDRHRLEHQLGQSQKMEAVGRLAGGVAHDFNNLLTAILGYCNLMLDDVSAEDPMRPDLEEIRRAGERAAELTRQLLAFSRRQMLQPQIVDVNAFVRRLETALPPVIGPHIEIVAALSPDVADVKVDPASLEQVLMNLAVNARDAMPNGGRLTIETANVELDSVYADTHATVVPGPYVMLAVNDTGQGMDATTRAHVFEPFFGRGKDQTQTDGLGLATVYGIVKQSGGYIWVYSEPGRGTAFKVYLPPVPAEALAATLPEGTAGDMPRAWETVLLVDDEDAPRALAREALRRHGYVVLEARHGLDALRVAERHQDTIHLMVTDVVMPYVTGRDLAERLASVRPGMKVLFVSGYSDHALMQQDVTPGAAFLQKPFTPEVLARKVRAVLDSAAMPDGIETTR
jgi:two-component system, cell cycle sensor histidine kinase and response regulator CckA